MIATVAIAIAAGCTSALMFASITSGALISLLLFYLAPLPLTVIALGWGPLAATIGGITAATGLGAAFGLPYCTAFAITVAVPAWWLGHLALLGRPLAQALPANGSTPAVPALEWYPVGRILLWIAGFAVLSTGAALLTLGTDAETITTALRSGLRKILSARHTATPADVERWIGALVTIAPSAAPIVMMLTLTFNLWLASRITATSGRLKRQWPDLRSTALPPMTIVALLVALGLCFTGGLIALLAQTAATALMMAYAFAGLAVLHTLTLSLNSRTLWLSCAYAVMIVFTWPIVALVILGIADALFALRERYLRGKPPPLPTS